MKLKLFLIDSKNKKLLEEEKYPAEIRRDDDNGKNFFVARQHFKVECNENFFVPTFKILLDDSDKPAHYTLAISADKNDITPEELKNSGDLFWQHYEQDKKNHDGEKIRRCFHKRLSKVWICEIFIIASWELMVFSKSLAKRRELKSQAKVLSTTQRFGTT